MCAFSSPSPPPPAPVIPPPSRDDGEVEEARKANARRQRLARGRSSTILTSALGAAGQATTAKKKLGE